MVTVTATELKNDLSHYLDVSQTEDVLVTRNGKPVSKLTNPNEDRRARMESLFGILRDSDMTLEEAREERLSTI